MNPDATDTIPHEFIDAEISVAGLETPADEQALYAGLNKLDGIRTLSISGDKVAVEYDPVQITKTDMGAAIVRLGFRVAEVESGMASTITDAVHPEVKPSEYSTEQHPDQSA